MTETSNPVLSQNGTLPVHHKNYYLEDGVIFLVENTLFRVPRYMLIRESPVFKDMFAMPSSAQPEGQTDDTPIRLLQVTAVDFERILAVIYPLRFNIEVNQRLQISMPERNYSSSSLPSASDAEDEEDREEEKEEVKWTSVLHLATRWQMSEVRKLSIQRLGSLADAVSMVILGRLYDYPRWFLKGLSILCMRNEPLRIPEATRLSKEDVLKIAEAREKFKGKKVPLSGHHCTNWRCCNDLWSRWAWAYSGVGLPGSPDLGRPVSPDLGRPVSPDWGPPVSSDWGPPVSSGWGPSMSSSGWGWRDSDGPMRVCTYVKAHLILDQLFGLSNIPELKGLISYERTYVDRLAERQKVIESTKKAAEEPWPRPPEAQRKRFAKLRESPIYKRFARLAKSRDTSVDIADVAWASDSSDDPDLSD